jgi:hypothetical protein
MGKEEARFIENLAPFRTYTNPNHIYYTYYQKA